MGDAAPRCDVLQRATRGEGVGAVRVAGGGEILVLDPEHAVLDRDVHALQIKLVASAEEVIEQVRAAGVRQAR